MKNNLSTPIFANLQLIYVSNIESATAFYTALFNSKPVFESPRYVAFPACPSKEALFAIWSGGEKPQPTAQRYSEIGIMVATCEEVDSLFEKWQEIDGLSVIKEPYTDVFGRTFLVNDPDGNLIRVSPID